eukprot:403330721
MMNFRTILAQKSHFKRILMQRQGTVSFRMFSTQKQDPQGYDSFAQEDRYKAKQMMEEEKRKRIQMEKEEREKAIEEGEVVDVVPEVFREHRHKYSEKPQDVDAYKRQVMYRCSHIGTKELEIILHDWLKLNLKELNYQDMEQFDSDILDIENPQLQRYFVNGDGILDEHKNKKYVKVVQDYVERRKQDYYGNIPKPDVY